MYSDASGGFGCGAFSVMRGWFQLQWPESWREVGIAIKEMLPLVAAAALWGAEMVGKSHSIPCGQHGSGCCPRATRTQRHYTSTPLHCLCFYAALFRLEFSASHIAGQRNMAADALSQDNLDLFSFLYPQVPHSPVPQVIQRLLLHSPPPDWSSQA